MRPTSVGHNSIVFLRAALLWDNGNGYRPNSIALEWKTSGTFCLLLGLWSFLTLKFWDVAPCSHVEVDRSFRGAYCLHYQGDWWWRPYAPLKRRSASTWLHGATSQKTLNFTLAAVRTWTLTYILTLSFHQRLSLLREDRFPWQSPE
jgi:hypothetical protein